MYFEMEQQSKMAGGATDGNEVNQRYIQRYFFSF